MVAAGFPRFAGENYLPLDIGDSLPRRLRHWLALLINKVDHLVNETIVGRVDIGPANRLEVVLDIDPVSPVRVIRRLPLTNDLRVPGMTIHIFTNRCALD